MSKQIPLTRGKYAIVDDEDYEWLNQWKWFHGRYKHGEYAQRSVYKDGKQTTQFMHRIILKTPDELLTDHINRNGLDNRRANLRICTATQNGSNRLVPKHNTSGYKGVGWHKQRQRWRARATADGIEHFLGYFSDIEEAAHAYDRAAIKFHGEFATLNFP